MLKVIQHRLDMYIEQEMAIEQAGSRKGRYTRSNIKFTVDNGKVDKIPATNL